jgi:hypothetical protein
MSLNMGTALHTYRGNEDVACDDERVPHSKNCIEKHHKKSTRVKMRLGRNEAELPLKMSRQDCARARAKLPPVEPWLSAAHSLMAGKLNTFCRTELKKQVLP